MLHPKELSKSAPGGEPMNDRGQISRGTPDIVASTRPGGRLPKKETVTPDEVAGPLGLCPRADDPLPRHHCGVGGCPGVHRLELPPGVLDRPPLRVRER